MTTTGQQMEILTDRIVHDAIDAVRIEGRLREYVSHAIEVAPRVTAWCRRHRDRQDELDDIAVWLETR